MKGLDTEQDFITLQNCLVRYSRRFLSDCRTQDDEPDCQSRSKSRYESARCVFKTVLLEKVIPTQRHCAEPQKRRRHQPHKGKKTKRAQQARKQQFCSRSPHAAQS